MCGGAFAGSLPLIGAGKPPGGSASAPTFSWANYQDNGFQGAGTSVNIGSTRQNAACGTINSGDTLVASLTIENETTDTITPPSGWTQLGTNQNDGTSFITYWYKIAGGSETCSYTFSWVNSNFMAWTLTNYSGANGTTPIDAASTGTCATAGGTTCTTGNFSTSATNTLLIASFDTTTVTTTFTSDGLMTNRISVVQESGTKTANLATQTLSGTVTNTTRAAGGLANFKTLVWLMVALKP